MADDERRILGYFTPGRKSVRSAWWLFLSGLALLVAVGTFLLAVL